MEEHNIGSAIVTPNMMLDRIDNLTKEVTHMASILDPALHEIRLDVVEMKTSCAAYGARIDLVNERVNTLSNKVWIMWGAGLAIATFGGYALQLIIGG
ncbi:MAG: hypothetical protein ACREOB_01475 [Thermodesulfobacteriota bacterium]